MAITKIPGDDCYITIRSCQYRGPAVSVWLLGSISQANVAGYVSPAYRVDFAETRVWATVDVGLVLTLHTIDAVIVGLADAKVMILDGADPATAHVLASRLWAGVYNFVYPVPEWRNISGVLAAKVDSIDAVFGS